MIYYPCKNSTKGGIVLKKRILALLLSITFVIPFSVASAVETANVSYTITNPYEDVTELLGEADNHYKTNLHTHSTVSDASVTLPDMVKEYYAQNFDILAMTEHGVFGRKWNEEPTKYYLMRICTIFNSLSDKDDYYKRQYDHLTDEEYEAIIRGTYGFDASGSFNMESTQKFAETSSRTFGRGMNCVTTGIELSAASILQNHVNGYFSTWGEAVSGMLTHEGDYEYFVKNCELGGGVTVINHPGHYLNSKFIEENARNKTQLFYFADIFNRYKSCLGIETFNNKDTESANNRIFWDELLQYVIPYGERNVYGFSNSDAHELNKVDTEFMDFILPSFSESNFRKAMENGEFFATGRLANTSHELGDGFKASGPVPQVTSIVVDDENDTITVTAKNAKRIEWIANGNLIYSETESNDNETISVIKLREHSDDITCYVRFQIFGDGGYCYSNPFICDDGNMSRFIIEDTRSSSELLLDKLDRLFTQNIFGALVKILKWEIEKSKI